MCINLGSKENRVTDLLVVTRVAAACWWACDRLLHSKWRPDPPREPRS
jgi:hypothetical protein